MSRRVYTREDAAYITKDEARSAYLKKRVADQDFSEKVAKNIPTEIIAAWTAFDGLLITASSSFYWGIFIIVALLTPIYMWRVTDETGLPAARKQIAVAFGAFIVWVFGMGGPFKRLAFDPGTGLLTIATITDTGALAIGEIENVAMWYQPFYGTIALGIASIVLVILLKEKQTGS